MAGFQINGVDVTAVNLNGEAVREVQFDGVTVWSSSPPGEIEIIYTFPTNEPMSPKIGDIWYKSINNALWWDGVNWKGVSE